MSSCRQWTFTPISVENSPACWEHRSMTWLMANSWFFVDKFGYFEFQRRMSAENGGHLVLDIDAILHHMSQGGRTLGQGLVELDADLKDRGRRSRKVHSSLLIHMQFHRFPKATSLSSPSSNPLLNAIPLTYAPCEKHLWICSSMLSDLKGPA